MQFRLFLAFLTLAILGLAVGSLIYILEKVEKPKAEAVEVFKAPPPKPIDPGLGEFDRAITMIKNRQLAAARDKLRYIIRYFPKSKRYADARRLCGEINLDLLVNPQYGEDKTLYEVKSGDAVSRIAQEHQCSLEYLKRASGLVDFKIRPGDKLTVRPLNFDVTLSTQSKQLVFTENGEFFAEYPIIDIQLPSSVAVPFTTKVRNRRAWLNDKSIGVGDPDHDAAVKEITLNRPGVVIRPQRKEASSGEENGIFMDHADVDELSMLLRDGVSLTITR